MILCSVKAQFDNLGDLVIRRNLVHWLEGLDDVRVVVGDAPESYVRALEIPESFRTYRGMSQALMGVPRLRSMNIAFAPGEQIIEDRPDVLKVAAANLALTALAKASRGSVVKVGRGFRGHGPSALALERLAASMSDRVLVRDLEGLRLVQGTRLMPDIALWGGISTVDPALPRSEGRSGVGFSFRSDSRVHVSMLSEYVKSVAILDQGPILSVTQVSRDGETNSACAELLRCERIDFHADHGEQLVRVERAYNSLRFVVSDRLHVLLFGLIAGVFPIGVETGANRKLARQLGAIGLGDLVYDHRSRGGEGFQDWVEHLVSSAPDLEGQMERSRLRLAGTRDDIRRILARP